jgi:hypothetical protein
MKGVITVGSGGGSGPTTTAASGAGSNVALVTTPKAAVPRSAGKPAIYWAGWGLFAVGALLALMLIALYVRFTPRLQPPEAPRGGGRIAGLSLPAGVAASSLTTTEASLGLLKIIAGGRCARSAHRPTIATPSRAWPRRGPPVTRR